MSRVVAVELLQVELPLVRPFRTSFGEMTEKRCVLVRVETDAAEGWGECVADTRPEFSEEFNDGAWLVLRDFLAPALLRAPVDDLDEAERRFDDVRGNPMAKAALLDAFVDAELRADGTSLAAWLGGVRDRVACGVSIGIAPSLEALLEQVDGYLAEGYRRIKLKIEPGTDLERVRAVRAAHPRHPVVRRRQRRVHAGRRGTVPVDGRARAPDDRTTPAPRGSPPPRRPPGDPPDGPLPRRVDPLGGRRRRGPRPGGVPDREREAGACGRGPRGEAGPRPLPGARRPGLVRRHAGDRGRPGAEPRAGVDAGVHAPGRHERVEAVLRGGPDRAVRAGAGRHDGASRRVRGSASSLCRSASGSASSVASSCGRATKSDKSLNAS